MSNQKETQQPPPNQTEGDNGEQTEVPTQQKSPQQPPPIHAGDDSDQEVSDGMYSYEDDSSEVSDGMWSYDDESDEIDMSILQHGPLEPPPIRCGDGNDEQDTYEYLATTSGAFIKKSLRDCTFKYISEEEYKEGLKKMGINLNENEMEDNETEENETEENEIEEKE